MFDDNIIKAKQEEIEIFTDDSVSKQAHSTFLEFIWTISPGAVLVGMIIPSFMLLYAIDDLVKPDYTVIVTGNQ
jgi:heme/copper-type cytochrome/quinol oxidase subunit 2